MLNKELSEIVRNYAQVAAWVAAGLFFVQKGVQGFFVVDLSLSANAERSPSRTPGTDYLSVVIDVKKGSRGSLRMHDAVVMLVQGDTTKTSKVDIERLGFTKRGKLFSIDVRRPSSSVPTLNLAAGESAQFGVWFEVRSAEPCTVEVTVLGTMFASPVVGQWRASAVSLPLLPSARTS